jgi:hypothetical protein
MSIETTFKTAITDRDSLVDALRSLYGESSVEVSSEGEKTRVDGVNVEVVLNLPMLYRKLGNKMATGFARDEDGTCKLVFDDIDKRKLSKLFPQKKGNVTVNELAQAYSRVRVMKVTQSLRGSIVEDDVDDSGAIRLRVRTVDYS